jgi:hypothetical protein
VSESFYLYWHQSMTWEGAPLPDLFGFEFGEHGKSFKVGEWVDHPRGGWQIRYLGEEPWWEVRKVAKQCA